MCAIFSSPVYSRFQYLYEQNLSRGNFAYGFGMRDKNTNMFYFEKQAGIANFNEEMYKKYDYFLGHTQAPTSSIRTFCQETSHPFRYRDIYCSHNGVLTNDKALKESLPKSPIYYYNEVDSSVIPALIHYEYIKLKGIDEEYFEKALVNTLSQLEGTYTLWVVENSSKFYNQSTVHFARSGSTLFMNRDTAEVSSVKLPDITEEVPEGKLFTLSKNQIYETPYGQFKANSPFFIL